MIYTFPGPFLPPFLLTLLQPSHIFLTELRTFMPLICSWISLCFSATPCVNPFPDDKVGLRNVCDCAVTKDREAVHPLNAAAFVEDRSEGKITRAVRRKVVVGIMLRLRIKV